MSRLRKYAILVTRLKGQCALISTLALMACSTVPKSKMPTPEVPLPAIKHVAAAIDAIPEAVPAELLTNTQTPISPKPALSEYESNEETPVAKVSKANKIKTETNSQPAKSLEPQKPKATATHKYKLPRPVFVDSTSRTGQLENTQLTEVSGMTASRNSPGVLYAINDSGNSATLFAMSEKGQNIGTWPVNARNRDWEDLDSIELNNQHYILIGDTGDNLKARRRSTFYLVAEPLPKVQPQQSITPYMTIDFVYEDGPRNVEAFAVHGTTIYLVSKEPLSSGEATASRLYTLKIPLKQPTNILTAQYITELPLAHTSLESKLAASFVNVDLDHFTAMDMSASGRTAYLLTYREIHKIVRDVDESWPTAFQRRGKRIHTHNLGQAEALALAPGRSVFFTSENRRAPLWAIPIQSSP